MPISFCAIAAFTKGLCVFDNVFPALRDWNNMVKSKFYLWLFSFATQACVVIKLIKFLLLKWSNLSAITLLSGDVLSRNSPFFISVFSSPITMIFLELVWIVFCVLSGYF